MKVVEMSKEIHLHRGCREDEEQNLSSEQKQYIKGKSEESERDEQQKCVI